MPELVAMIQTTWPDIRVGLYILEDSRLQFVEECRQIGELGNVIWTRLEESHLYDDISTAKKAMIEYYCSRTEDEFKVDASSVTVLEAPDFTGSHHPILIPNE